jgi:phosphatidate cytidylyltransferase
MNFKNGSEDLAKLNDAVKRIGIALIFIPLLIFSMFVKGDNGIILLLLVIMAGFFSGLELLSFIKPKKIKVYPILTTSIIILLIIASYLSSKKIWDFDFFVVATIIILSGTFILFILQVFLGRINKLIENLSVNIFSFIYPGLLLSFIMLVKYEFGPWYLALLFAIPWISDGGAYFIGTFFGKTKLKFPASPNKSLEGYLGGLASAVIVSILLLKVLIPYFEGKMLENPMFKYIVIELIFVVLLSSLGFIGDLLESAIKRDAGRKDSYKILKLSSHGGLLDIIDSIVFVMPIGYFILKLSEHFF